MSINIFNFSNEIILGNFYRRLAIFYGYTANHSPTYYLPT